MDIREVILETKEPLLIQNKIKTFLLNWNLNDWKEKLKNENLEVRCGKNKHTTQPQWESTCKQKIGTLTDLLNNDNPDEWWYYDYKYLKEWLIDVDGLKVIDKFWSDLGFPETSAKDSTIWIGSQGAHTCCHMDTYGCNLVFQVYGRKQWMLFPPEKNLRPTRIPYEESSIYSKLNFFSPNLNDFKGLTEHCRKVILNPGDVLVLPHKWWHYVENLETSISVNTWLPLPEDNFERIKEGVAQIFVSQILNEVDDTFKSIILNPNMVNNMLNTIDAIEIINASVNRRRTENKIQKVENATIYLEKDHSEDLAINKNDYIKQIPELSTDEFKQFLHYQISRFKIEGPTKSEMRDTQNKEITNFLEAIVDDEVLSLIATKLLGKS